MRQLIIFLVAASLAAPAAAQDWHWDWSYETQGGGPVEQPAPSVHRHHRSMAAWKRAILREAKQYCRVSHDKSCPR
jgi:hypothetical protein